MKISKRYGDTPAVHITAETLGGVCSQTKTRADLAAASTAELA